MCIVSDILGDHAYMMANYSSYYSEMGHPDIHSY
jgi:hypothetical protein